jgi:hypothetical protein
MFWNDSPTYIPTPKSGVVARNLKVPWPAPEDDPPSGTERSHRAQRGFDLAGEQVQVRGCFGPRDRTR